MIVQMNQIVEYMQFMDELFGDDFYIEVAPAASKDQIIANNKLVQILEEIIGLSKNLAKLKEKMSN